MPHAVKCVVAVLWCSSVAVRSEEMCAGGMVMCVIRRGDKFETVPLPAVGLAGSQAGSQAGGQCMGRSLSMRRTKGVDSLVEK